MRGGLASGAVDRIEEHEITSLKIGRLHVCAGAELLRDRSWHRHAILIEDVPDETAAIKPRGIVAAIFVGGATELQCRS